MKKKIAITGGIGSGKSYVLQKLQKKGFPIFSCDDIYRDVIQSKSYIKKIEEEFPDCIIEGKIDRKRLAQQVFNNKENLQKLNAIAHPLIMSNLLSLMDAQNEKVVFAEVPLLFEGNFESLFDEIIVVMRTREERISSIVLRDKITCEEASARIAAQFDYDAPENLSRLQKENVHIIFNNGSLKDLDRQINELRIVL